MPTVDRRSLALGALLTLGEAAAALPARDAEARAWLKARGLVADLDGRPVVVWARVLDALAAAHNDDEARVVPLPRKRLEPLPRRGKP